MVKECQISLLHAPQIVSRLKVAYTCPGGATFLCERRPRISFRLLFYDPVGHDEMVHGPSAVVTEKIPNQKPEPFLFSAAYTM
jgi:hypothetical protein